MRSFFAISLALVAGCGDNLSGPQGLPDEAAPEDGVQAGDPTFRVSPEICGARSWDQIAVDAKDSELRAVGTDRGVDVFMVARGGSMLRGFQLDGHGLVIGDPQGQKIRSDALFTGLSAARVDDRLVVGLVSGTQTTLNVIRDDLGDYRELAVVDSTLIGDSTMMHSLHARVAATGGASGMLMTMFDANWTAMETRSVARSVPVSMTSAPYGGDAIVAWSTTNECHLQRVASGVESMRPYPCLDSRLAVDYASGGGWMVYEAGEGLMLGRISVGNHNQIANQIELVRNGRAPRIAFDGQRYWVSYLDARNDVVVGFLDDNGALDWTWIDGTQPADGAYDLAVIAGVPWVYAMDGRGVSATRLCAVAR